MHCLSASTGVGTAALQVSLNAGRVRLLVNPSSAQYTQNPICVYYCCSETGALQKCIAVVTNTPWGAAVSFLFDPHKQAVPKALHVSPFMDMQNTWWGSQLLTVVLSFGENFETYRSLLRVAALS